MNNSQKLLPAGFCDLIGNEAKVNQEVSNKIISNFLGKDFNLVKTPLMEFEQTLSNYQRLNEKSFYVFDISSGKNLVFRNDITVQIARLVNTRLKDAPLPLKLCYLGDVLKVDNSDLHSSRQLTQAGIEIIGGDSSKSALEVLDLTIESLKDVTNSNLTIEFCLPKFLDLLLEELKIKEGSELKAALIQRNISKIHELAGQNADIFTNLVLEINNQEEIKANLNQLNISKSLRSKIDNLLEITNKASKKYPQISFLIGVFSDKEFLYHEEVGFTVFAKDSFYPIARGGKYQINDDLPAIGSTIYVDELRKILVK